MEMDPHERESDMGDESPVSHEEELSDQDVDAGLHDEGDSCDGVRSRLQTPMNNMDLSEHHPDVLAKLKKQVRNLQNLQDREELEQLQQIKSLSHTNGGGITMSPAVGGGSNGNAMLPPGLTMPFTHPAFPLSSAAYLQTPMAPPPAPPSSGGSSHSSEGSASSQHTWSFEEQFKQVRQLYEISDDPKRKEFLDDLFSFMQKRGSPINRLPIMAKSVLDLYELYNLVIARGGLVDVINKKLWQEIIKGLKLPSSITSAAFTLRTQYMKYLYPYECEKCNLSNPNELQAAIDGNRREGRRSSYGTYDMVQRSPVSSAQMSPMTLMSQHQTIQSMANKMMPNGAHHPSHALPLGQPPSLGPIPGIAPEFESRMAEYIKLFNNSARNETGSPTNPFNPIEMSRLTLWNLYNQTQQEPQREALNLSDPTPPIQSPQQTQPAVTIKRELPDRENVPPAKRVSPDEEMLPPAPAPAHTSNSQRTSIKITSREESPSGDNSMVVTMDINGTIYQGVLFAQNSSQNGARSSRITT